MGKPIEITRTEFSASELRELAASTHNGATVRRLLALALVLEGHCRAEAARLNGTDRQTKRCATGCIATTKRGPPNCVLASINPGRPPAKLAVPSSIGERLGWVVNGHSSGHCRTTAVRRRRPFDHGGRFTVMVDHPRQNDSQPATLTSFYVMPSAVHASIAGTQDRSDIHSLLGRMNE
jgi:hypothetical protein